MNKKLIRLNESEFTALVMEKVKNIIDGIISNENGEPMVFYHSCYNDNYDSGLIYLSTDEDFSREFGEKIEAFYIYSKHPYVTEDGEYLRDPSGNLIMYEDEPVTIGWLDAIPEEYLDWFRNNYDCMMDCDGTFTVVFDKSNLIPIDRKTL